jgi:hypothetical protein
MFFPLVLAGFKYRRQFPGFLLKCGYLTRFVAIALKTGPCKVIKGVFTTMFNWDDVVWFVLFDAVVFV